MELGEAFNSKSKPQVTNSSPFALDIYYESRAGSLYTTFDFMTRVMMVRTGTSEGGITVTPFSHLDRDVIVAARDKLVALGGTPPELAPEAQTLNKPLRGLNP